MRINAPPFTNPCNLRNLWIKPDPQKSSTDSDFLTWAETGMALFTRSLSGIGPQQSTNPATTGCPLAARECRQTHDHASLRANGAAIRVGDAS